MTIDYDAFTFPGIAELTYGWLNSSGLKVDRKFINNEIVSHPEYPSLVCVTDLLDSAKTEYYAQKFDSTANSTIVGPAIIQLLFPNGRKGLYLVTTEKDLNLVKEYWSGVALYLPPNQIFDNERNDEMRREQTERKITIILISTLFTLLSVFTMVKLSFKNQVFFFSTLLGVIFSLMALSQELGLENKLTKAVCGIGGNPGGCSAVLDSKYGKGLWVLTPGVMATAWFSLQYMILSITGIFTKYDGLLSSLVFITLLGFPIALWSLYTQSVLIKQWCAICLSIVVVLFFQATFGLSFNYQIDFFSILVVVLTIIGFLCVLISLKRLLNTENKGKVIGTELEAWKRNFKIFSYLYDQQPLLENNSISGDIELSNPKAKIKLIIACNPMCAPCAQNHVKIDQLIENYKDNLSVVIRFIVDATDSLNERTIAANAIVNACEGKENPRQIIHEWFKHMQTDRFLKTYNLSVVQNHEDILKNWKSWSTKIKVAHTPTVYMNGREIPRRYSIEDIRKLIPEIAEKEYS